MGSSITIGERRLRLLRYQNLLEMPWKNGGGVTREVISHFGDDSRAEFLWRVSIATVASAGQFSIFAGIDRTISVLSGSGIVLDEPDGMMRLTVDQPPYSFAGETPIQASVINGTTTDLNAMSRREHFRHRMQRIKALSGATFHSLAPQSVLIFGGDMHPRFGADGQRVGSFDALIDIPPGAVIPLGVVKPTLYYVIEFYPSS